MAKKSSKAAGGSGEAKLRARLAVGCRVLAMEVQGDAVWGHATQRVPGTETFWMKPAGLGLEEVGPEQMLLIDLDGKVLRGKLPRHSEVFIHSEIMRARPDVNAVVHTHPVPSAVFASLGVPLRPIIHEGSNFVPPDVPRFNETTDLIVTPDLGKAVARTIGNRPALFLVSHGIVTIGASIEEAVTNALLIDKAARAQLMVPGGVPRLWTSDDEALRKRARIYTAQALESRWDYLQRVLARRSRAR